jgi:hypothetical protein
MKLVKEHINEKFVEDSDPIKDMSIGLKHLIEEWLIKMSIENKCKINDDFTIDSINACIDLEGKQLENFPDYITFSKISGGFFDIRKNNFTTLRGCPKYVDGFFACSYNKLTSLKYSPKYVGGDFTCINNLLTSLDYVPKACGNNFYAYGNKVRFTREYIISKCRVRGQIYLKD